MGLTLGPSDFGVTLGSVWVSVGDFGSLDGHFAMIVESFSGICRSVFQSFSPQI